MPARQRRSHAATALSRPTMSTLDASNHPQPSAPPGSASKRVHDTPELLGLVIQRLNSSIWFESIALTSHSCLEQVIRRLYKEVSYVRFAKVNYSNVSSVCPLDLSAKLTAISFYERGCAKPCKWYE